MLYTRCILGLVYRPAWERFENGADQFAFILPEHENALGFAVGVNGFPIAQNGLVISEGGLDRQKQDRGDH